MTKYNKNRKKKRKTLTANSPHRKPKLSQVNQGVAALKEGRLRHQLLMTVKSTDKQGIYLLQ